MRADLTKVRQALFNLLSNAGKFTEKGTVTLSVRVEIPAGSTAWVVFDVADTGIGLTEEQIGRLSRSSPRPVSRPVGGTAAPASGSRCPGVSAGSWAARSRR